MQRVIVLLMAFAIAMTAAAQDDVRTYDLPGEDVYPEGIAYGAGSRSFYTGSTTDGTLYRGDTESGEVEVFLQGSNEATLDEAYGMALDRHGRLWIAGGTTGRIAVYDTGRAERVALLDTADGDEAMLNDVVVARDGHAYVTDSTRPVLFRIAAGDEVGDAEAWLDLTQTPIEYQQGEMLEGVNLNGIVATDDGAYLLTVDMNDGSLYRIDTESAEVTEIDLGGESVVNGDGLVLRGRTLHVVRIADEEIVTIGLSEDFTTGTVENRFRHDSLAWPATAAVARDRLLVVNTQFDTQDGGEPDLPFQVVSLPLATVEAAREGGGDAEGQDAAGQSGAQQEDRTQEGETQEETQEGGTPEDETQREDAGGGADGQSETRQDDADQGAGATDDADGAGEPQADEPEDGASSDGGEEAEGQQADGPAAEQEATAERPDAGPLENYASVTDERLIEPDDGDWLMWLRTYDGWGYSPLDQITPENVERLRPVWSFSTGVREGHEAPVMVNDGVMFVSTPENRVMALDAATGDVLWRYDRDLPHDLTQFHPTNRGVALYGDAVYLATLDAALVALDARTGEVLWERQVEDPDEAYYMTLAPLAAEGRVLVGVSGGEFGVRGFVQAFDADTGEPLWKTFTIPAPGEPGNETWPGDTWQHGGAPIWMTGSYDPESGITYWGTGNAAPWVGEARPGDNLYANSVVALNLEDGELVGHHQYHPNGSWDWDEVATPLLIDFERDGRTIPGLVHVGRNGYIWWLERQDGGLGFVDAQEYVYQNVFEGIDPQTGRPEVDETHKPSLGNEATFCPSLWGGKDWPPAAFNPETRLLYIPANEFLCGFIEGVEQEYVAGQTYFGANNGLYVREGWDHVGELQAWNVDTGEQVWTHEFEDSHNWGSVMTTGGGLVFIGGTNDRNFRAFDAESGELVWEFRTNSGIIAVPVSFEVDGTQYVAVQSGWGVDAVRMQNAIAQELGGPWDVEVPQGGIVWVFALDGGATSGEASETP